VTQKFYLHDANSSVAGTLPTTKQSSLTSAQTVPGASTPRVMNGTIGTSTGPVTVAINTNATTSAQPTWFRTWVSPPLAAGTYGAGSWHLNGGYSEANAASNFFTGMCIYFWRPGTGAMVGTRICDVTTASSAVEAFTAFSICDITVTGANVTIQNGDVLVVEWWRENTTQSMGTAYNNTIYYDGTTEGAAPIATYLNAPADIPLQLVAPSARTISGLVASPTSVALSWTADAAANPVPTYAIWQSTDGSSFSQIATGQTGQTGYTATSLTTGQPYWFYVVGNNSQGSSTSNTVGPLTPTLFSRSYNFEGGASGSNITTTDTGSGDSFDGVGSSFTPTYNTTQAMHGTKAMAATGGVGNANSTVIWNVPTKTTLYARFYLYITSLPTSPAVWRLCTLTGSASTMDVWINNTGPLFLQSSGTNGPLGAVSVPTGQWVRIELSMVSSGPNTVGTVRLYKNADSFLLPDDVITMNATAQFSATTATFGEYSTSGSQPTIWLDDLALSEGNWLGPAATAPSNAVIVKNPSPTPSLKVTATSGSLASFSPVSGSTYLLLCVTLTDGTGTGGAVTSVAWSSGGSGSWGASPLARWQADGFSPDISIWMVHCTSNPGPSVIAVTGGSGVLHILADIVEISGDNYTSLLGATANSNSGTVPTVTLTPTYSGSWIVAALEDTFEAISNPTPNAATAISDNDTTYSGATALSMAGVANTIASTAQTIALTNTVSNASTYRFAAEIRALSAGPTATASLSIAAGPASAAAPATATASMSLAASATPAAPVTATASMSLLATGSAAATALATGTASLSISATGTIAAAPTATAALSVVAGTAVAVAKPTATAVLAFSATAGAAVIAGTATAVLVISATGTFAAPVSATAVLVIAASAPAIAAPSATASLTLLATGTASAVTGVTGTAVLVFSAGPVATVVPVSATAALSLLASAAARAAAPSTTAVLVLSAGVTAAAVPTATAVLVIAASTVAVAAPSATAQLTFAASAVPSFSGAAALTITATMAVSAPVTATAVLVIGATAAPSAQVTAIATMALSATATALVGGGLTGAAVLVVSASVTVKAAAGATAVLVIAATGAVQPVPVSGTAVLSIAASAAAAAAGTAAAVLVISATGSVQLPGVSGTAVLIISATAIPKATMTATSVLVISASAAPKAIAVANAVLVVSAAVVAAAQVAATASLVLFAGPASAAAKLTASAALVISAIATATAGGITGYPKVWTGSTWALKPAKVWTGTSWATKPVKVWTGSTWKTVV